MDIFTETPFAEPDLAQLLPRTAFYEILWMLRSSLPPPLTDDPVDLERRDQAAMAAVASLLPVTVAEGRLAAQFASADAWARDCQVLAAERRADTGQMRRWLAQAVSLMRESRAALRELRQMQVARRKRDAEAENRAEWEECRAVGMMRGALGETESQDGISETDLGREFEGSGSPPPAPPHEGEGGRKSDISGGCGDSRGKDGRRCRHEDAGLGARRPAGPGQSPGLPNSWSSQPAPRPEPEQAFPPSGCPSGPGSSSSRRSSG